ncbi:MAG TPA: family 78 glycoside hydrolase catalytic domain [Microbacterium sp.]|uniref:family 78 glycoside hydrolase catalytic domain n=1 Tax=Microbacterium sp. TaxID=51671 RepID=UPI002B45C820|nr:family 78 glycoside hydrolase catalytic domain [Microbacterium sp.]HKT55179.1 family 78 glycoside hydrolase catalytic domain [Microbacterium sp.]
MPPSLTHLRADHLEAPLALRRPRPRLTWRLSGTDATQRAYRIVVHETAPGGSPAHRTHDTGWVRSPVVAAELDGFDGAPGHEYRWDLAVRLSGSDEVLEASGTFGIGLQDWSAAWAEPAQQPVVVEGLLGLGPEAFAAPVSAGPTGERLHPPRHLRQRFELPAAPVAARLRITSQGVHQPSLNGAPVGDGLLAPGYESYQHAISVMTHDVTAMLSPGENVLGVVLGDGWYAGRISILGRSAQYGDTLRASWRLEVDLPDGTRTIVQPDAAVRSSRGPIDWSDIFIGERHDARAEIAGWDAAGFDDDAWTPVELVPVDVPLLPFIGEPIRRVAELPVERILATPAGETVLDFGQVIAGRVRMTVAGDRGTVVRLEHAEVVDAEGDFLDNILGVNKDQADEYVLAGTAGGETWEPLFTFHGFRYVKLVGYPGTPRAEDFTAVVIANDLEQTASFASSDARLDKLVHNTVWSQRSNFLAVPTDCPQRERAGWTGDLQVFAPTAATLMGVASFLERWLDNVRLDQRAHDGVVPIIVPMPPAMDATGGDEGGVFDIRAAAGWSDAITIAPWELYRHYGDERFLRDNYAAMTAWVAHQTQDARVALPPRLTGAELTEPQRAHHELLWNGRMNFGDWLAPSTLVPSADAPFDEADVMMIAPKLTAELTGPLFQIRSLDLTAASAEVLHHPEDAARHRAHAARVREAFAAEYVGEDGRIIPDMQGIYVLALAFDAVPDAVRPRVIDRLVDLVHAAGDHLDTGFVSVPFLLDVLWDNGHADLARTLMRQDTAPSWLYEIDRGATTIWEAWHAVHEDGTVDRVSMNHYAFGCVVDWMMRRLAGLELVDAGYARSRVAPDLDGFLDHCAAHIDTPHGRLAVRWERDGDEATLEVTVPAGTTTEIAVPAGWRLDGELRRNAGIHSLRATRHIESIHKSA